MNTDSPLLLRSEKIFVILDLVSTDFLSFVPMWRRILVIVDGRAAMISGSLERMEVVVAPGKDRVLH